MIVKTYIPGSVQSLQGALDQVNQLVAVRYEVEKDDDVVSCVGILPDELEDVFKPVPNESDLIVWLVQAVNELTLKVREIEGSKK